MRLPHRLILPLLLASFMPVNAAQETPDMAVLLASPEGQEYCRYFPDSLQTKEYLYLAIALTPVLRQELYEKKFPDWKYTKDGPCPLGELFLNKLTHAPEKGVFVKCTPDDSRIVQVLSDEFGAFFTKIEVYTRQADGLWAKTNLYRIGSRHATLDSVTVDDDGLTVSLRDEQLGLVVPNRIPFANSTCRIRYRSHVEIERDGKFTALTSEIFHGSLDHLRLMLETGKLDPNQRDKFGLSPLDYTDSEAYEKVFGSDEDATTDELKANRAAIRELLIKHGAKESE